MIATCTNCQARYQLENANIPKRIIQVRCPACQGVFALDGNLASELEIPVPETSAIEPPAPVEEPMAPAPVEPFAATPETAPFEQPAAVVDPIIDPAPVPMESAPTAFEHTPVADEPAPAAAPAATGVAILDEPAPASGSSRRRRCKEEMLARALVSDILVYNRETRDAGLEEGNLLEALGGEIKKSWELYKEKVTPEVANSTTYFREALNEILADGNQVF